jgi:hypothetical protein
VYQLGSASRAEAVAGLPVSLPPRPALLAGREELLAGLDAWLSGGEGGPRVVALYGLGGAGKTSVAVEYAHRHLAEVGLAWQFSAEDPALLEAEFARLAAQLGAREVDDARDPVASVHAVLTAFAREWLLVFDNAGGQQAVRRFLPPAGNGRVLITSQSVAWPPGQAVEVPVLATEVAAGFLVTRTGDTDERAAAELAAELGGLPLALEQAAAYIVATGRSLARYLESFRQRRGRLLTRGTPTGYNGTVATTWSLAFTQLEQFAPQAVGLLRLLACCAPEAIPVRLLLQPRPGLADDLSGDVAAMLVPLLEDELAVDDAVLALRQYSLVTPVGDGLVLVHRLVQAITHAQVPPEVVSQWQQAAAALVEATVPANTALPAAWPVCAVLLPHARAVLDLTSVGLRRIADYLGESGSYPAARDLFQLIVGAYTKDDAYGSEHPDTLAIRHALAYWTGEAGDAAGARDQFAALLPIVERVLGAEHQLTLATRHALAYWTGVAGDAAGARDLCAALLPIEERVLGLEHLETLYSRLTLAIWTGETGDAAGARDQLAALPPIFERVLGAEHLDTLITRSNLTHWTGIAGDAAGARDQCATLQPIVEQVLGPEHRLTLTTRRDLARWTGETGDAAGSRDQLAALLPIYERVLGAEHPDTLYTRHDLARWTGMAEDAAGARDQLAALQPIVERIQGAEHPATLTTRHDLARWTGETGDAAGARDQLAALLPIIERVQGAEHPDTLATRLALARWTRTADGQPEVD